MKRFSVIKVTLGEVCFYCQLSQLKKLREFSNRVEIMLNMLYLKML